jgi:hypothetical protein
MSSPFAYACIEMSCPIQLSRPLNICQLHQSITDALGNLPFSSGSTKENIWRVTERSETNVERNER